MSNDLAIFEKQLAPLAPRFSQALAGMLPIDKLMQSIITSVERTPQLLRCTRESLFQAAMSAACLGLPVDGVTGQAWIIPFSNRAQLIIGYRGFNTLAARADITINGGIVREGDAFDFEKGSAGFVRHKPILDNPARRIVAAWAVATHLHRPPIVEVMGIDEILAVKAKSPGARKADSPWNDPAIGFPAMAEKTPKRRLTRSMPLSVMQIAARLDEAVEEQGKPAWISPERGLEIEDKAERIGPFEDSPTPSLEQLTEPAKAELRELEDLAAEHGTATLETAWKAIAKTKLAHVLAPELLRLKIIAEETDARLTRG